MRENGPSTNGITTPHHETPPGAHDGYFVLQCESAGVDFALGHCVRIFSNTITCTDCGTTLQSEGTVITTVRTVPKSYFILQHFPKSLLYCRCQSPILKKVR